MTPSVAIFDDRIEFMNPGAFPIGTTPDEFRRRPQTNHLVAPRPLRPLDIRLNFGNHFKTVS